MKKALSLLLAATMLAALWLPATAEGKQRELIFWTRINDTFEEEIAAFEALYPDVTVTRVGVGSSYDDLVTKYIAAAVSGELPHVGLLSQRYGIPQIYDAGVLVPIERFMTEEEQNDIMAAYWERYTYNGERVAVPFQSSMPVLYVNKALLTEQGVAAPTTWEEVQQAAAKLTLDTDGDGVTDVFGFNMPDDAPWYVNALVREMGGEIIHEDGSVSVDIPQMVSVLRDMQRMTAEGSMPSNQHGTAKDDFKNGAVAMLFNSCAGNKSIAKGVEDKFEYALTTFPAIEGRVSAPIGGNALGIFQSDADMEALSWAFVQFMTSSDAVSGFTMDKGYLPIKYSFMETDFVKARLADDFWAATFDQVQHLQGQPVNPVDATIWSELNDILSEIESDPGADVEKLVQNMQREVDDFLLDY